MICIFYTPFLLSSSYFHCTWCKSKIYIYIHTYNCQCTWPSSCCLHHMKGWTSLPACPTVEKLTVVTQWRNCPHLVQPERSLPCSQHLVISSYPEPHKSNHWTLFTRLLVTHCVIIKKVLNSFSSSVEWVRKHRLSDSEFRTHSDTGSAIFLFCTKLGGLTVYIQLKCQRFD